MATILISVAIVGGGMLWYTFSTAYQEIEEMTDMTPLVTRIQQANEQNIKKFDAELSEGQGGKIDGTITKQKIISGEITIPNSVDYSKSVLYVALLDDKDQTLESRFLQGDIIQLSLNNKNKVQYSIPIDFEIYPDDQYTVVAFLDVDNDYINTEADFIKSIQIEELAPTRIQYFDIDLNY